MEAQPRDVRLYKSVDGKVPFTLWLDSLRDTKTKTIINKKLDKVRLGLLGDCESIESGVFEFRIDYGPGYRIYFGQIGSTIVLLYAGDKGTQTKDIRRAIEFWLDYEERESSSQ